MSFHKDETGSSLHVIHAFTYADAATRLAGAGLVAADIGKIAKQTDTNRYYILLNNSPVAWSETTAPSNGGGGVNYIINTNSEDSVAGWVAYADAASSVPVDGTGGAPNVTITRSTVLPLRGAASFLITKDAANRQGQGISYDFTIDRADLANQLSIEFDYEPGAGFVAGDLSDLRCYIYDITNAQTIQPTPFTIQGGLNNQWTFKSTFQTSANGLTYRLILHIATVSAIGWTFKCDNFRVGPQPVLLGAPVSDWVSYTPSVGGLGTGSVGSVVGKWRRVGDSMEIDAAFTVTIAGSGASNVFISIPSGFNMDGTKLASSTYARNAPGHLSRSTATTLTFLSKDVSDINLLTVFSGANLSTVSENFAFRAIVPILGWGSTVIMSNDTDTRVVAAKGTSSTATAFGNGIYSAAIPYANNTFDTHGAMNFATGVYTVPVAGIYRVSAGFVTAAYGGVLGRPVRIALFRNGSINAVIAPGYKASSSSSSEGHAGSVTISVSAGETLDLRGYSDDGGVTLNGVAVDNFFTVERLSGPSTIAASETIAAAYSTAAGQSIPNSSGTLINYGTKDYDTHGAVTTGIGVWNFRCPISGKYQINAYLGFAANGVGVRQATIRRNGVNAVTNVAQPNGADVGSTGVNYTLQCNAGDTIDVVGVQTSGGALVLQIVAGATYNFISIIRVGN